MALVRIFSDLHLEFGLAAVKKCAQFCSKNPTKYTILAGDITNFKQRETNLKYLVSELKPYTEKIIYVLGNHEYYELGDVHHSKVVDEYKKICKDLDITLLENESLETEDFTFYGATMWTKVDETGFKRMNDQFSFKNLQDVINIHNESKNKLESFIKLYDSVTYVHKPLVVITHHMPSFSLIDKEYEKYKLINTAFASELDYMIKDPIGYWVYGHTHKYNERVMNGVKLFCNPHGYPNERYRGDDYRDCIF
jgi:predicted phosphodiesterase